MARLAESPESKSVEPEKSGEATKESPKAAQVYVGTKPKFVRTNPPKEAPAPVRVANALKALAMGPAGKKTEPTRPLLKQGETSLSKLVASNQGGVANKQPEQKSPPAPVEKRSLKDLLSNGKPIGSGRKTSSKLGAIASPEEKPVAEKKPAAAAVLTSLSQLAGEVEPSTKQQKVMNAAKPLVPAKSSSTDTAETPVKNSAEKFQRSLLAARIANDSKAKASSSASVKSTSGSLTDIILGQEKPALAQQNVASGEKRRTSLFPAKKESKLSRLIQK